MKFHTLKEKLHKEQKAGRRIGGFFGVILGLIMAFSFFPAKQAQALDVDLSDQDFILLPRDPADLKYDFYNNDAFALGIKNVGATNHSPAQATHGFDHLAGTYGYNVGMPRLHPKSSKSYNGKYGNRAYTLMDDSYGNKNIFKMLEVTDKSGDAGKKLRGTSKFYSGDKDWQRFEFEFLDYYNLDYDFIITYTSGGYLCMTAKVYRVHMRSEKTGNYIVSDGPSHGASMHVANPGDSLDLWLVVWPQDHKFWTKLV